MIRHLKIIAGFLHKHSNSWDDNSSRQMFAGLIHNFQDKYEPILERVLKKRRTGYLYDMDIFITEPQLRLATSFIYWHRMVFDDKGPFFWEMSRTKKNDEALKRTKRYLKLLWLQYVRQARTIRTQFDWIRRTSSVQEGKKSPDALRLEKAKKITSTYSLPPRDIFIISKMKPANYADGKLLNISFVKRILKANLGTASKTTLRQFFHNI